MFTSFGAFWEFPKQNAISTRSLFPPLLGLLNKMAPQWSDNLFLFPTPNKVRASQNERAMPESSNCPSFNKDAMLSPPQMFEQMNTYHHSYLMLLNDSPSYKQCMYCLSFRDSEVWHGLLGTLTLTLSQGSHESVALGCSHLSSEDSTGKDPLPRSLMPLLVGVSLLQIIELRLHFFMSCWTEASFDPLPCGPLHRASHNMELSSLERAGERTRKSTSKSVLTRESSVF